MKNLLLSAAIGDIAGMPYEYEGRTKKYDAVDLLLSSNTYTDDTVCTFACAEALIKNLNMAENLWKRCRADFYRGYGGRFARWLMAKEIRLCYFCGNGSAFPRTTRCAPWTFHQEPKGRKHSSMAVMAQHH